jgi:hypothetical protein
MPPATQLEHKLITDLRLPYRSFDSPTAVDFMLQDGRNVYSNARGYLERRPGFNATVETVPTAFSNVQRIFTWSRWPGTANAGFYVMTSDLSGGVAKVYKYKVGSDTSSVLIFTSTSAEPFDFLEANNHCFFGNGTDMKKYDGSTVTNWGIARPSSAPSVFGRSTSGTNSFVVSPSLVMNGWGANGHVGDYEAGFGLDSGTTYTYTNAGFATDNNEDSFAEAIYLYTHKYAGIAWKFSAYSGDQPTGLRLEVLSEVPYRSEGNAGTASVWYSFDDGATWTQLWKVTNSTRTKQWDYIAVPDGADLSKLHVMAFMNAHDDNAQRIYEVRITGSTSATVTGHYYRQTYGNSKTGHQSSSSSLSAFSVSNSAGITASPDPQVDEIHVYRTTENGSTDPAKMQELPNSPFPNSNATVIDGFNATLLNGITQNETAITIDILKPQAPFIARIDDEFVLVTSADADSSETYTSWTVQRGYSETTAAAHSVDAVVQLTTNITKKLGVACDAGDTTLTLDANTFYASKFEALIDDELVAVTGCAPVGGTNQSAWVIERAYGGTSKNSHSAGTMVRMAYPDTDLEQSYCPGYYSNDPAPASKGFIWSQNRVWAFKGATKYYSGYEELTQGVPEESFPGATDGNYRPYKRAIHALAPRPDGVATFTAGTIYGVDGDTLDTFRWFTILEKRGTKSTQNLDTIGSTICWLDTSAQVWNSDSGEVGLDVRPDLKNIDQTRSALRIHISGEHHWLTLLDVANGLLWVLNLDTNHWQVPWTVPATAIHSGETADGQIDLIVALNGTRLVKLTPDSCMDNGAAYPAWLKTNLFQIADKPEVVSVVDHIEIERNSVPLTDVLQANDEDTRVANYTSIFANEQDPPDRGQRKKTAGIVAKQYKSMPTTMETGSSAACRVSFKLDWGTSADKFELYTIDVAYDQAAMR